MLFNSYSYIFIFLPVVIAGYYALGPGWRSMSIVWVILASLLFYTLWRPLNVLLMAPSILVNYGLVKLILRPNAREGLSRLAFWTGIMFNLCFLGYFKYRNFFFTVSNDFFGASYVIAALVLPLGISFITFQKIGLLIDVRAGRVTRVGFRDYLLFVMFFPQLVAGPIVHYRELMPQFAAQDGRPHAQDFAVGLTLLFGGLFKKVIFADLISPLIAPVYASVAAGGHPALLQSWMAAIGFTLQIYFDFSGYSDMAVGAARMFGVKLPFNFNSPLKSVNLIEFWQRWHVSLTRFLTDYVYSPLAFGLARWRSGRGRSMIAGRRTTLPAFLLLLAFPSMLTMILVGLWHDAGYQFLIFGTLHGTMLGLNHGWRLWRPHIWPDTGSYTRFARPAGFAITFTFVVVSLVFFRAPSVRAAVTLLDGLCGRNGITLPMALQQAVAPWIAIVGLHTTGVWESGRLFVHAWVWIAAGLFVVLALPNSLEVLAPYDPALGFKRVGGAKTGVLPYLTWSPSAPWAVGLACITVAGILSLGQLSDFIYWHF